jgi:hypothetical protein
LAATDCHPLSSFGMAASWKPDPEFTARFGRRRELYLSGLKGAVATLPDVVCDPDDQPGTYPGIDFAIRYLTNMINEGFHVAYAVSLADGGVIYLQKWERPDVRQRWQYDPEIVFTSVWRPQRVSRRTAEAR